MPRMTLHRFAQGLVRAGSRMPLAERAALSVAAGNLARQAKGYIGDYQPAVPPFPAWPPLAGSTVEDRVARGYTPNDPLLRQGDLRRSVTGVVRGRSAVVGSTSPIAPWQELGTSTTPARSFLGRAVAQHGRREAQGVARAVFRPILTGRL